jgi:hypothetical protein
MHRTPQAILDTVLAPGFSTFDQWEAQMLAMILVRARRALQRDPGGRAPPGSRRAGGRVGARLEEELGRVGRDAPVALLPEGPMTIPCLRR